MNRALGPAPIRSAEIVVAIPAFEGAQSGYEDAQAFESCSLANQEFRGSALRACQLHSFLQNSYQPAAGETFDPLLERDLRQGRLVH